MFGMKKLFGKQVGNAQAEMKKVVNRDLMQAIVCLLYTSPSPRDGLLSRMPSSA